MPRKPDCTPHRIISPRVRRFVQEYLIDFNAAQAALRAGYSQTSAAGRLMKRPAVRRAIARGKAVQTQRTNVTAEQVIRETVKLGFVDFRDMLDENDCILPPGEWPDDIAAAVAGFEVQELFRGAGEDRVKIGEIKKVKLWDKVRALEKLGTRLNVFCDKVEHSGPNGGPIEIAVKWDLSKLDDFELDLLRSLVKKVSLENPPA